MRHMSFALTTAQVSNRTKRVTRRLGWRFAKVGDVVQPVVKGQGIKKGEHVEKIGGAIRFVRVHRERLDDIVNHPNDCDLEGFPDLTSADFVQMFCEHNGCAPRTYVTRIEFEYVETHA